MEFGFPEFTDSFLSGQDILYTQFNDIEFFVEDTEQEYFYFHTLKKVFPNLAFEKIFPLNGKANVKNAALLNTGSKKKIYIVDLDFDEILGSKEDLPNLFYLERYSIENYLLERAALQHVIKEHRPTIKDATIEARYDHSLWLTNCQELLGRLSCVFLIIQTHSLGIEYLKLEPGRDVDFTGQAPQLKGNHLIGYFSAIETALKTLDGRYTVNAKIKRTIKHFVGTNGLSNIPGKYILAIIKFRLEKLKLIPQSSMESFAVRLAKNSDFPDLQYLRDEVLQFIA